jgi:PHD/YefM family antitoxin component YafN of YafNO toxin-antitoxin module
MIKVAASEFARNFGRYREAVQREPVAVTNHDRITGVMVSPQDFEEYQALRRRAATALWAHELSEDAVSALREARMDDRHSELDRLLDE